MLNKAYNVPDGVVLEVKLVCPTVSTEMALGAKKGDILL